MDDVIPDRQAIDFSAALYETLSFGRSVPVAFEAALAGLHRYDGIPKLYGN